MESGLVIVTILLTAILWQCHGAQASDDENTESVKRSKLRYSVVVKSYKNAYKGHCALALEPLDGCSTPVGDISMFYRTVFTPACLRHDICYRCGVKFGWTRYRCDKAFERDMYQLCSTEFSKASLIARITKKCEHGSCSSDRVKRRLRFAQMKCYGIAYLYHKGVRAGGYFSFGKKAKKWCSKDCAKEGGDPEFTKDPRNSVDKQFDLDKLEHDINNDDLFEDFLRDFDPDDY
uniref:Toxin candidate TRINITY_DN16820_c0_g2_i1 n=1 Tax=Isarachnanthus nocturnus TaxID=1240238 RepID=A0A7G7WZ10_9CNID|nr:toxin candidate TRINITY_DN16820_c0_g2_i1 [Isarachnanthus nocturnus]